MWHRFVPLLIAAGKVLFAKYLERPASTRALSCGYSFERHMQYLAEETSIPLMVLKPNRATFEPVFKGRGFITVLVHQEPNICLGMFSNISFPQYGIPPAVCDMIRGLCEPSDGFRLLPMDGPDGSFVIADGCGSTAALTPATFIQSLDEMMRTLALVDAWIVEKSYAR
jgi:hypothetical protein